MQILGRVGLKVTIFRHGALPVSVAGFARFDGDFLPAGVKIYRRGCLKGRLFARLGANPRKGWLKGAIFRPGALPVSVARFAPPPRAIFRPPVSKSMEGVA